MPYEFLDPSANSTSSLAQVAVSSAESFSAIPASVLSRLNLTDEKSCSNGNETESCHDFLYGMTCEPLTETLGGEKLIASVLESRAKKLVLPAMEKHSLEQITTLHSKGSFAKLDRQKSIWKTAQCLLVGGLEDFSDSWPKSGTMENGECFPLASLEPAIIDPAFGFWLSTPCKTESKDIGRASILARLDRGGRVARNICGRHWQNRSEDPMVSLNPCFAEWMMDWPIGWTDLKPLEMVRYQAWLHSHGIP